MPIVDLATAAENEKFHLLAGFLAGYAAILATPGPNMLAVGTFAALRGVRGAAPLCIGAALGAGTLGAALLTTVGAAAGKAPAWQAYGRVAGVVLLLYVAVSIVRPRPPHTMEGAAEPSEQAGGGACGVAVFGVGFCTAATNPLTGAFFAAQFLGPLGGAVYGSAAMAAITLIGIVATALIFFLGVTTVLALPAARRAAVAWHRPIQLAAAAMLVLMAAITLWPLLAIG
ncbi:MAG TPA: LysE family transporter [Acetobacteraceae bacterium]|nr:LysE family transporter [Acetobacteraceae bacterium]